MVSLLYCHLYDHEPEKLISSFLEQPLYKLAFFMLLFYLLLADEKVYALLLMVGLALNVGPSFCLKNLKRELGDIDQIDCNLSKIINFRKFSLLFTASFLLNLLNFLFPTFILIKIKTFGGADGV